LKEINKFAINPDLIVYLDISPEQGLSRIGKGQRIQDDKYFEDIDLQRRIRQTYHEILNLNKPTYSLLQRNLFSTDSKAIFKVGNEAETVILSIDASQNQDRIQSMLFDEVQTFLKQKGIEKQPGNSSGTQSGYSDLSEAF
jgi:thymidylate kinase